MSVTTGVARASYAHVYQPVTPQGGGDPKYQITLLIPKSDTHTLNSLTAEIEQVKQSNAQQFGGQTAGLKIPLYDGDGAMPNGGAWGEECHGHMVLRASSKDQPTIVDTSVQPLLSLNAVYSGCYVRASVNFYAYNQPMNKGIGCGLNAVQKIADGEPLANRVSPEEAFGGANAYTGTGQGQTFQPGQYQTPAGSSQLTGGYAQPTAATGGYTQPAAPAGGYAQPTAPTGGYTQPTASTGGYTQSSSPVPPVNYPQVDPITGLPAAPGGVMGI